MPYFIDVILPIPLQKAFTYAITEAEAQFLKPGIRVAVPFGKKKLYTALVYKVHQNPPLAYEAKPISCSKCISTYALGVDCRILYVQLRRSYASRIA